MKKFAFPPQTTTMKGRISFSVDSLLSQKTIENQVKNSSAFTEIEHEEAGYNSGDEQNVQECSDNKLFWGDLNIGMESLSC